MSFVGERRSPQDVIRTLPKTARSRRKTAFPEHFLSLVMDFQETPRVLRSHF